MTGRRLAEIEADIAAERATLKRRRVERLIRCRFCGAGSLIWGQTRDGRPKLYRVSGRPHSCSEYRSAKVNRRSPR
jgi:hypothetical protein